MEWTAEDEQWMQLALDQVQGGCFIEFGVQGAEISSVRVAPSSEAGCAAGERSSYCEGDACWVRCVRRYAALGSLESMKYP